MSTIALRRLRIWLVFLATLSLIFIIAQYIFLLQDGYGMFSWADWLIIITGVIVFASYIHSLRGKPFVNKFLRAFLLFVCAVVVLFFSCSAVAREVAFGAGLIQCDGYPLCYFYWAYTFVSITFGFFSLFEIGLTLKHGPLQPKTQTHGQYGDQGNVVIVSPDQPQGYYPGALQQPAMISHQQNPHYPQYPQYQHPQYPQYQYPQHQFTQAAPVPGGHMIEVQEGVAVPNGQVSPQQHTYASPQLAITTPYQQPAAHDAASSPLPVSEHPQAPSNASGQPPSPHYPAASGASPQPVSSSA